MERLASEKHNDDSKKNQVGLSEKWLYISPAIWIHYNQKSSNFYTFMRYETVTQSL